MTCFANVKLQNKFSGVTGVFPRFHRLHAFTRFPRVHVFLRLTPIACFPALGSGFYSRGIMIVSLSLLGLFLLVPCAVDYGGLGFFYGSR